MPGEAHDQDREMLDVARNPRSDRLLTGPASLL
jgi:hypothetical protein